MFSDVFIVLAKWEHSEMNASIIPC